MILNLFIGSVFLPIEDAKRVFEHQLNNLPLIEDDLTTFVQYLRSYWLPKLDKVSCWNDNLPRTNNPAEAYHGKLRSAFDQ